MKDIMEFKTKPIRESFRGKVGDLETLGSLVKKSPEAARFLGKLGLGKEDAAEAMRILKGR